MKNMEAIKAGLYFSYCSELSLTVLANRFGSKLVDTQMVFPKDFFLKKLIKNISRRQNSMENYPVSKVGYLYIYIYIYIYIYLFMKMAFALFRNLYFGTKHMFK